MKVRVRFFGQASELAGVREKVMELPEGWTLQQLEEKIYQEYPNLEGMRGVLVLAVNGEVAPTRRLEDEDEVAVLPPVAGG